MNIGILMPTMAVTGGVRRVVEIANRLIKEKHKVTIYNNRNNHAGWMNQNPALYIQKPMSEIFNERIKDIWLCGWPNFSSEIYNTIIGKKFYMIQHIENSWIQFLKDSTNNFICFSSHAYDFAIRQFGKKVYKITGGINLKLFNVDINKEIERRKNGYKKKRMVVLCYPRKQAKHIVEAAKGMEIELRFLGSPKIDNCEKSENYLGKSYNGLSQSEIKKAYQESDLYVSVQMYRHCWDNTIAEAMACGCPAMVNNAGAIQDMKNGIIVYEDKIGHYPEVIRENIKNFINSDFFTIESMIKTAHKTVTQFDWDLIFPELLGVLNGNNLPLV